MSAAGSNPAPSANRLVGHSVPTTLPRTARRTGPAAGRRPGRRVGGRADTALGLLIGLYAAYSLALLPLVPALIGSHPLLLEIVSGSTLAEATVGAQSRLGELPLWLAVVAGLPGTMAFDWIFWWAGRRWGDRALHLFLGRDPSPRGVAKREARAVRLERMAERYGPAAVVLAYYLPLPSLLIYAAAGLSGMRLRTFVALDLLGTLPVGRPRRRPGLRHRQARRGRRPSDRPLRPRS